jgi:photosystem II stability/assembly factor-like uncharacterized protein/subtilisin-like proprotein convertase family protein
MSEINFTKTLLIISTAILLSSYSQLLPQNFWQLTGNTSTSFGIRPIVTNANGDIFMGTNSDIYGEGIFRSTDGGNSWIQSGLSNLYIWDIVIDTSGNIFAGTRSEGVWRSTDNGDSWTEVNTGFIPQDNTINSLAINSNGEIYAGATNAIYVFSDSGDIWTPINSPNYNGFYPLEINADGDLFVGVAGGRLFRSIDKGLTWTEITIAIALTGAIAFNELGHVFAGNLLGIYRSTDKGDNWTQINNGINVGSFIAVNAFTINSAKTMYVGLGGGFSSTSKGVFYSINNGDNWIELNDGLTNNTLSSLTVDQGDYLYAGNTQGEVYKSSNSTTANNLIQKLSDLNLVISDANPAISTINFSPPSRFNKTSSVQGIGSVQVVIDEVTHQRTGDLTFTLEHLGVSQTIIFEVGADGQNFISTILSEDNTTPIANGSAPFTGYFKPDNPLNVFDGADPYGDWTLTVTDNYSGNDGILSSWSLIITHDGATDVETNVGLLPGDFVLEQNYPNPFNPSTKIKYTIPSVTLSEVEGSKVALKIYDVLGNEVATLVNEEQTAGTYEVEFDATLLTSGVYFYKLQSEFFIETKKMILIK